MKIACGHRQTRVGSSSFDRSRLARWARNGGLDEGLAKKIECADTARKIFEKIGLDHPLTALVAVLLVGYDENKAVRFGNWPQELERKRISWTRYT